MEKMLRSDYGNMIQAEPRSGNPLSAILNIKTDEMKLRGKEHRILKLVYLLKDRPVKDIDKMYTVAEALLS